MGVRVALSGWTGRDGLEWLEWLKLVELVELVELDRMDGSLFGSWGKGTWEMWRCGGVVSHGRDSDQNPLPTQLAPDLPRGTERADLVYTRAHDVLLRIGLCHFYCRRYRGVKVEAWTVF